MNKKISYILSATILSLGIFGSGYYIAKTLYLIKRLSNNVTVKGIAERDVTADLALWEINYREVGNDLTQINTNLQRDRERVNNFLTQQNFKNEEITATQVKVEDRLANIYNQSTTSTSDTPRYVVTAGLRIRSTNVQAVQQAMQKIDQLLQQGVSISLDTSPNYLFTQLDSIRPDMLAKATASARVVAQQFANDADTKLCGIQTASQGMFQITARDTVNADYNNQSNSTIDKKVRLVTTIVYRLC